MATLLTIVNYMNQLSMSALSGGKSSFTGDTLVVKADGQPKYIIKTKTVTNENATSGGILSRTTSVSVTDTTTQKKFKFSNYDDLAVLHKAITMALGKLSEAQ